MLALADAQRAVATIAVFIATFLVTLSIGRLLKRRAGVPFGIFFQLFALTLGFYAAAWVYGFDLRWRNHTGAALVLLSTAVVIALVDRYLWDLYFEQRRHTVIPKFLRELVALVIFLIALLLVLSYGYNAERELRGLLATSGAAAIILAFATQNLLGGVIAGMALQVNKPYKAGDWLQVGERFAEVMEINWRSTRLRTNDNIYLDIPNNEIIRTTIVNLHYPTNLHAMRIRVGIDYRCRAKSGKGRAFSCGDEREECITGTAGEGFPGRFRRLRPHLRNQILHGRSFPDQRDERLCSHQRLVRTQAAKDHHPIPDSHPRGDPQARRSAARRA